MELRTGCSSWTSESWAGRFYPPGIPDGERLAFYARYFDCVEVDSSFYRPPAPYLVQRWGRVTPDGFRLAFKFPRDLLDPKVPIDREGIARFGRSLEPLGEKLGAVVLQFAPSFRPDRGTPTGQQHLAELLEALPPGPRYSVELRDSGWYQGEALERLRTGLEAHAAALTWSYLSYVDVPPERTTDFTYVRFIGDHTTVPEEQHGEIRVDRRAELELWARRLQRVRDQIRTSFVFFNNHFAGFAPDSINQFRQVIGAPELPLPERTAPAPQQRRLDGAD